jgi:hypothetical protein
MTRRKTTRSLVRNIVQSQAFARLDLALAKNTHSGVAEHDKTRLWLLKIFGRAPDPLKIQK